MTARTADKGSIKVLILGGYGVFGGRLAQLLGDLPGTTLFIAGRSLAKAQDFCSRYSGQIEVRPLELDRRDVAEALAALTPDLLVDASGPFQDYGTHPYSVIEACVDAGVDYLDFADAADFVFGVSQFDHRAQEAGIFILSGVSSFPVLTAAVLRKMSESMEIVSVEGGIAPSPFAGVGLNVMRAVIGYAGAPVKLLRDGKPANGIGLAETTRYTIAPPGRIPLRNIRFSLVDVPDSAPNPQSACPREITVRPAIVKSLRGLIPCSPKPDEVWRAPRRHVRPSIRQRQWRQTC